MPSHLIVNAEKEKPTKRSPQVSSVIRLVVLGLALPVYATVGAGGFWLKGPKVSANVLQAGGGRALAGTAAVFAEKTKQLTYSVFRVIRWHWHPKMSFRWGSI